MTATTFRFYLDRTSKKFPCPSCGQKRFVKYVDAETGDYISDNVGRCDRENDCGMHTTPKEHFKETGKELQPLIIERRQEPEKRPIEYLPTECFAAADIKHRKRNNFFLFLIDCFGWHIANECFSKYFIGTSKQQPGSTIFFQVDEQARLRTGKVMQYDKLTGKRLKDESNKITWVHKMLKLDINFQQIFFGQHLLDENPDKKICIVESEKTAVIAGVYFPKYLWLATGGAIGGCKWREYEVYKSLKYRTVTFFPDYGYSNKKTGKTCFAEWCERVQRISEAIPGEFHVSDLLEKKLSEQERDDRDLLDLILKRDETGRALTDHNYPVMFDLKPGEIFDL